MFEHQEIFGQYGWSVVVTSVEWWVSVNNSRDVGGLVLGHDIFHVVNTKGNAVFVGNEITQFEIGLRNCHSPRRDIVNMPAFWFVVCCGIFYHKIVIISHEMNVGIGVFFAVSTPRDGEFSFVVGGVSFFFDGVVLCERVH